MNLLKKILTVVAYVGTGSAPIVAATGVGLPVAGVLGAVGLASGAWLHWMDSPRAPQSIPVNETLDVVKAVQQAVKK
jgi:hypothetical protein